MVGAMEPYAVSISTSFDYAVPIEAQVPSIAEAGFTHFSLGADPVHSGYPSVAGRRRLQALARAQGLAIDTIHGPRADRASVTDLAAVVDATAELQVPVVVIHGGPFDFPPAELRWRLEALRRTCDDLGPILEQAGVLLALENVLPGPATDLVCQAVECLDAHLFGFCYDSSHDQIGGPRSFGLLERVRTRLTAVQLSDRVRDFVDHVLPGEGFIDWQKVCSGLRLAQFSRPLLLEVAVTYSAEKDPQRFLRLAHERGLQLARSVFE